MEPHPFILFFLFESLQITFDSQSPEPSLKSSNRKSLEFLKIKNTTIEIKDMN